MNADLVFHLLEKQQVDAILVGGLAAVAHGVVYMTNDIDLCYDPAPSNLTRLVRALEPNHLRLRVEGMTDDQSSALPFQWDERTLLEVALLTLQTDAGPLDLMRTVPGVGSYADVRAASIPLEIYGVRINALDLPGLIASKRTAARPKDLMALPHIEMTLRVREEKQARRGATEPDANGTSESTNTGAQQDMCSISKEDEML